MVVAIVTKCMGNPNRVGTGGFITYEIHDAMSRADWDMSPRITTFMTVLVSTASVNVKPGETDPAVVDAAMGWEATGQRQVGEGFHLNPASLFDLAARKARMTPGGTVNWLDHPVYYRTSGRRI